MSTMLYPQCQLLLQGEPHPDHAEKAWNTGMQNPASEEMHTHKVLQKGPLLFERLQGFVGNLQVWTTTRKRKLASTQKKKFGR